MEILRPLTGLRFRTGEAHTLVELRLVWIRTTQALFGTPATKASHLAVVKAKLTRLAKASRAGRSKLCLSLHAVDHCLRIEARPHAQGFVATVCHDLRERALVTAGPQLGHHGRICCNALSGEIGHIQVRVFPCSPGRLSYGLHRLKIASHVWLLHLKLALGRQARRQARRQALCQWKAQGKNEAQACGEHTSAEMSMHINLKAGGKSAGEEEPSSRTSRRRRLVEYLPLQEKHTRLNRV